MASRTQIYRELLREYDALRTQKAAELRRRREDLYERLPRLAEIEQELSLFGVSAAKLVLQRPDDVEGALLEWKRRQNALEAERLAILAKHQLSPKLLQLEYQCENCKDTGYVENTPCICMKTPPDGQAV